MKAIYYMVTFVAALLVIAFAGWETYLHWPVLTGKASMISAPHKHKGHHKHGKDGCKDKDGCCKEAKKTCCEKCGDAKCACEGKCNCDADKKCGPDCKCPAPAAPAK